MPMSVAHGQITQISDRTPGATPRIASSLIDMKDNSTVSRQVLEGALFRHGTQGYREARSDGFRIEGPVRFNGGRLPHIRPQASLRSTFEQNLFPLSHDHGMMVHRCLENGSRGFGYLLLLSQTIRFA